MRDLLVMRHGKASPLPGLEDREIPLHDRGKRASQRLGVWLWQQDLRPELIVTSPAERALVSAEKCCKAMDLSPAIIRTDERLFPGATGDLLEVLRERAGSATRVLLVGHKPACDALIRHLARPVKQIAGDAKLLRRGALAHLQTETRLDALSAQCCSFQALISGRKLPKKFPYPAPDGREGRARPAYYYTQSGVIPFRENKKRLEVLVVRSSQRNHWVVPKGVAGPGQTLQESAAEEALEEAGVTGDVLDVSLGGYDIEKWGARVHVHMFPLRVQRVLDEAEWEEQHRGREWLSIEEAAERVMQPELKDMIRSLPERVAR